MTDAPLTGFGVLVTRPRAQASELIDAIESAGGTAFHFPAIEIAAVTTSDIQQQMTGLTPPDIAIFVSRNAVEFGRPHIDAAQVAAIGPSTALALHAAGDQHVIEPDKGYDSESLLAHDALQDVRGKHVHIIRGGDGRELLATELSKRGAHVTYLTVYQRLLPDVSEQDRKRIETAWREGQLSAITVMSVATLHNLVKLLPEWCASQLECIPLVTPAARVIKEALDLYPASTPVLAAGPQADDMLQAILSIHRNDTGHAS